MRTFTLLTLLLLGVLATIVTGAPVPDGEKEETTTTEAATGDPSVNKDDGAKGKPDLSPMDYIQGVIKQAMQKVSGGFKDHIHLIPISL